MQKKSVESSNKFTREKQRKYRKIINPIASEIQAAFIMHKLKNGHKGQSDTAQLAFDEDRKLTERKRSDAPKRGAVDILGKIEDIDIGKIRLQAIEKINSSKEIEETDKEHLKEGINQFILKEFINARENLEGKKHLPNKNIRQFYRELVNSMVNKGELSYKEGVLYREICLTFANILYEKDHNYINKEGQITQEGLQYIGRVFLKTIKNIPNSGSSKSFHKIFHDGDFNFLRKESSEGNPKIGTLDHYVRAIIYLMDSNSFNAYAEGGTEGANEWYKSKKSFLNNLYTTMHLEDEDTKGILSDKGIIHKKFSEQRQLCKECLTDSKNWDLTDRLKTEASKILKIGGRTRDIKDESGIRATYYGNMEDKEGIKNSILALSKRYLEKILSIEGVTIKSIQADMKGGFITKEAVSEIIYELGEFVSDAQTDPVNISERTRTSGKKSKIDSVSGIYKELTGKKPRTGLQQAYKIASGEVVRGSNGKYSDFKLIVEYSINNEEYNENIEDKDNPISSDTTLFQEISFYPHDNDLGIGNHNFLDLEKRIFNRVKNMNDPELGKSISLNRLRYFAEAAIKDISFDIDIYEDKIKRGALPKPANEDYKYLKPDGKFITMDGLGGDKVIKGLRLDGLTYRTAQNSKRFDELIPIILNYFLKKNKIFYINKENEKSHGLITVDQLYNKHDFKIRRFSTSDALRNIALDAKNENHSISIYTTDKKDYGLKDFHIVYLGDLGDFISLEETIKKG